MDPQSVWGWTGTGWTGAGWTETGGIRDSILLSFGAAGETEKVREASGHEPERGQQNY